MPDWPTLQLSETSVGFENGIGGQQSPQLRTVFAEEFEFVLFGDALLVAPIIRAGGETQVYFPAGERWFDLQTGECIVGGQVRTVTRAIDEVAVFGREGYVLCLGKSVMHTGEINLASPVEEVQLFGVPTQAPCVMESIVSLSVDNSVLRGVSVTQCRVFGDVVLEAVDGGVRFRRM